MSAWDDIALGVATETGRHTFSADEIKDFARQFDPQRFHVDEDAAAASHFGGLCASGWHSACIAMRFIVETMARETAERRAAGLPPPQFGPAAGIRDVKWEKPVYAGDTVTYTRTITAKRPLKSRPGWGMLTVLTQGRNQHGETVIRFESAAMMKMA